MDEHFRLENRPIYTKPAKRPEPPDRQMTLFRGLVDSPGQVDLFDDLEHPAWDDPGPIERGDYLEIQGKNRIICAVAMREERNGRVLIRNECGIQRDVTIDKIANHVRGLAIMAGPLAHGNESSLLNPKSKGDDDEPGTV